MDLPKTVFDGVIDVSHNNGAIDWKAVAGGGIALAFIKATEGLRFLDPLFPANLAGARAAGLMVVPYHFLDPGDTAKQAQRFASVAGLKPGDPAMIDWETAETTPDCEVFTQTIAGIIKRDPVEYYGFAKLAKADPVISGLPLMLPEYPKGTTAHPYAEVVTTTPRLPPGRPAARPYDFHQYTPGGRVAGIAGPVDRSVWVGTAAGLAAWHKTGVLPGAA